MYELEITKHFSGAHKLAGYPGDCRKLHGHNWNVTVLLQASELDEIGIALDFKVLKKELNSILDMLDHKDINTLPEFEEVSPSSEILSKFIYTKLKEKIVCTYKVSVWETERACASYFED